MSVRFRALQHRNFQLFIGGQLVSLIGTWMQSTAQLWLVYKLTGSAALLGLFGFANGIPILFLATVGGYVGDRYSRHRGVIWTQTASMALALALAALTLTGTIRTWEIIFIALLVGIVNAFDVPIRQAFFVQMVGKEDLPNAIALNSSIFNGARVAGPAIAGFTIMFFGAHGVSMVGSNLAAYSKGAFGEGACFLLNGVSFLAVIAALLAMRIPRAEPVAQEGSAWKNLADGFRYVWSDLPVRSALLLLSMLSLLGLQYSVFLPIFATKILNGNARTMGLLMSSAGVGAVLGALHFAARESYKGLARWITATSASSAVGLILFSQSRVFWLSVVMLFFVGFAATVQMAATNTVTQRRVPDELRSRVMAVYAMMFMGVQPIGSLLAGGMARRMTAPVTLEIFGMACLAGAVIFFFRVLLPIERKRIAAEAQAGLGQ